MIINNKKNKSGFTLIELMVVISIVSILSAVILVSLNKVRDKGENTEMVRQVREYANAIQLSYVPNGNAFPGSYGHNGGSQGCLVVTVGSGNCNWASGSLKVAYPSADRAKISSYISLKPITPPITSSNGLVYDSVRYSSDGQEFRLYYPMKNTTDCGLQDAAQFGSLDGDVTICRYVSR